MASIIPLVIPFVLGVSAGGGGTGTEARVFLDDGTGTYPHDVSSYVHLPTGLSITRGRADELATVEPGTMSLRLDNVDGRFTLGDPTYPVYVDQPVAAYIVNGGAVSQRFTGWVNTWPTEWPSPVGTYAVAAVTASDRLAQLSRGTLDPLWQIETQADDPLAYWPMDEPDDAKTAGDRSGNHVGALQSAGEGKKYTFGASDVIPMGGTGVEFQNGRYLSRNVTLRGFSALSLESMVMTADTHGGIIARVMGGNDSELTLELLGSGKVRATYASPTTGGSVTSDTTVMSGANDEDEEVAHHLAVTSSVGFAGSTLRLYVDGDLDASTGIGATAGISDDARVDVGRNLKGKVANVAVYDYTLAAARIKAHARAALDGYAGERTDNRIRRLAGYAGLGPADLDLEVGAVRAGGMATGGVSPLDAMREVATTEGGLLYVNRAGVLVFQNRWHRTGTSVAAPGLTLDAEQTAPGLTYTADTQFLVNRVNVTRVGGGTQVVRDRPSIALHGEYALDLTVVAETDDEAQAQAEWMLVKYADPDPRLSQLPVDLLTQPALRTAALGLDLSDRITLDALPTQAPDMLSDLLIEGYTETFTDTEWTQSFNTTPSALESAWVLDDAGLSDLGDTTRLGF